MHETPTQLSLQAYGVIAGIVSVVVVLAKLIFGRYMTHDEACNVFVEKNDYKADLARIYDTIDTMKTSLARIEGYLMPKSDGKGM